MKSSITFIGLLLTGYVLQAQITFSQGDFPEPGIAIEYYEGWSDSVDMGSAGPTQIFDFSKIFFGMQDTFEIEFMDPSATPFGSSHPNATVAFLDEVDADSATGKTVYEGWEYIRVTTDNSYYDGKTFNVDTANMFSQKPPTSMVPFHSDYDPIMEFVGSTWSYQSVKMGTTYTSVAVGNLRHDEIMERNVEIDAWGIFKNPWHNYEALRFKVEEFEEGIDSLNGQQTDNWTDTSYYYEYWVKGLGYYIARAHTDPTYTYLWQYEVANVRNPIGIQESSHKQKFNLYPVPARDVLNIESMVTDPLEYEIRNLQGSLVMYGSLPSGTDGIHQLKISGMKSGMYILDLKSGNQVIGKEKFIVK